MPLLKLLLLGFLLLEVTSGGPVFGGGLPDEYFLPAGSTFGGSAFTGGVLPDEYFLPAGAGVAAGGFAFGTAGAGVPDEYFLPPWAYAEPLLPAG